MSTTNTWGIVRMDAYPEFEGNQDVVFSVNWVLSGIDGPYAGGVQGSVAVTLSEGGTFTPYADLTEAQVVGWVHAALGPEKIASYEANVAEQIANQITPPVVTPPLPWAPVPQEEPIV